MSIFERFKDKTIEDAVNTAKETVTEAVKTGLDEKVNGLIMLLPLAATAMLIFAPHGRENKKELPTKTVINNYYYGVKPERKGQEHVDRDCKGCR